MRWGLRLANACNWIGAVINFKGLSRLLWPRIKVQEFVQALLHRGRHCWGFGFKGLAGVRRMACCEVKWYAARSRAAQRPRQ
jgi:hypothetical protein